MDEKLVRENIELAQYNLGDRVKLIRIANHLKQSELARKAKVSQADLSRLERGFSVKPEVKESVLRVLNSLKPDS